MKKILLLLSLSIAMCSFCRAEREIIFDNVSNYDVPNFWGPDNLRDEMGDEVFLGGTGRTIERFEVECYSNIATLSSEKYAVIRFYREDGEFYEQEGTSYDLQLPNTLLYESYPISVSSGYSIICLDELNVPIPDQRFTWTIQFYGLSLEDSDKMGVIIYSDPTVGSSYEDFWLRKVDETYQKNEKFKPYNFVNMKANFGVRIYASFAPEVECTQVENVEGGVNVSVKGPVYAPVEIQSSENMAGEWKSLGTGILEGSTNTFFFAGEAAPYYRALKAESVPANLRMEWGVEGISSIKLQGGSCEKYSFRYSTNAVDWVEAQTGTFIVPWDFVKDETALEGRQQCFYSIVASEPIAPSIHKIQLLPEQESNWIYFKGPRGKRACISYSYDGEVWSKPMEGKFTYFPALSETKEGSIVFPFPRTQMENVSEFFETLFKIELLD